MANDHEIGRVVAVDTAQVTIELNRDLKALTRSTYEGTIEVGSINSYVIIPVGSRRIVAMVLNPKPHFPSVHSCVILSKNSSINYLKSS
jgi:hypothetical protein